MSQAFLVNNEAITNPDAHTLYFDEDSEKYYKYENNSFVETIPVKYSKVIELYVNDSKYYADAGYVNEITSFDETAIYYMDNNSYTYDGTNFIPITPLIVEDKLVYETDEDFQFVIPSSITDELGGNDETFDKYCDRIQSISQKVQSSRIALVEKEHIGKHIARICSTPYYIEPGYLPFMSVGIGVFNELDEDSRDTLFGTGLIFGEDDYTLSTPTPRICLATSTAWGVKDHDMRTTDALIHARRNVDHHIRQMLQIIAPQLKRNETSVTLRYLQNQVDLYLNSELEKGTIQSYDVQIYESNYNPYTLLIKGKITPVNSTLAIEFENTVGSPYTIASEIV